MLNAQKLSAFTGNVCKSHGDLSSADSGLSIGNVVL